MNEYHFENYCSAQYMLGLGQDDANAFYEMDSYEQSQIIRNITAWQLVVWLGEYLTQKEGE